MIITRWVDKEQARFRRWKAKQEWRPWFAWHPVEIDQFGRLRHHRWWEWVERRWRIRDHISYWEYRPLSKERT